MQEVQANSKEIQYSSKASSRLDENEFKIRQSKMQKSSNRLGTERKSDS